ncbi:hypothetical protein ACO2Q7_01260 [Rathayibacter sp. KR2-224]|uniref:hypothetical protein n=1 Tax=Rathayibacter sp. KR2-224 TaxID=3400913 RepID=UPI003C0E76A2
MGECIEKFLDNLAAPGPFGGGGKDLRALWNAVPHVEDPKHSEDKDWSTSEPDPEAP